MVIEEGKLARAFVNSVIYTVFATVLCVVLATAAAFVLARNRTRLNRLIYLFLVIGIAMPINYVTLTKVMQVDPSGEHAVRDDRPVRRVQAAVRACS